MSESIIIFSKSMRGNLVDCPDPQEMFLEIRLRLDLLTYLLTLRIIITMSSDTQKAEYPANKWELKKRCTLLISGSQKSKGLSSGSALLSTKITSKTCMGRFSKSML